MTGPRRMTHRWPPAGRISMATTLLGALVVAAPGTGAVAATPTPDATGSPLRFAPAVAYPTGEHSHGVGVAEVTGSPAVDLLVANAGDDTLVVLRGRGDGTFAKPPALVVPVGHEPKSVAIGRLDADASLDVVTANQSSGDVSVLLGTGTGGFAAAASVAACHGAHEAALADLDLDGDLDIAVACWGGTAVAVLVNDGSGRFASVPTPPAGDSPHSVAISDLDGDGDPDLAFADHGSSQVTILRNDRSGDGGPLAFTALPAIDVGANPHSIRAGDLDGDGRPDLVTADDGADTATVLRNAGPDGWVRTDLAVGRMPKSVAVADLDGDGALDIVTANINGNYPARVNPDGADLAILRGHGDGTFAEAVPLDDPGTPFAVVAADVDGNGRPDLVTADWNGNAASVLLAGG